MLLGLTAMAVPPVAIAVTYLAYRYFGLYLP
jgi:hypothetical protein